MAEFRELGRVPLALVDDDFPKTQPMPLRVSIPDVVPHTASSVVTPPSVRAARPFSPRPPPSIDGMSVREVNLAKAAPGTIPVSPREYLDLHVRPDTIKIKKSPEPRVKAAVPRVSEKWHRSILDVGDGNFMTVIYKIIAKKPSGRVVIEFENPFARGKTETREVLPSELRRGYKELEIAPSSRGGSATH